jgi:hypothetical protein
LRLTLRPFFLLWCTRFTAPRRGRHFFAAIRNARRADFIETIFVPRILATRHFLYFALDPGEQTAAFRRLDLFLTILHRSRKFTDTDYRRLRAREVLRHLFEPFSRPYLHRRFPAFRRPTFRRLAGAFPASFLRHIFAARPNALRAAFGVLNLMRLIAETIHFLYPRAPPTTRRLFVVRLRLTIVLSLGDFAPRCVLVRKTYKGLSKMFLVFIYSNDEWS